MFYWLLIVLAAAILPYVTDMTFSEVVALLFFSLFLAIVLTLERIRRE